MGSYITTYTHRHFDPTDPDPELILIEDIAHALSMLCRGNGHVSSFWSVGEHCICCAKEAAGRGLSKKVVLACLLHDASECYMSDVPRPLKQNMKDFFDDNISGVCALIPGVLGTTGIETAEIIKAVSEKVKPNLIIAVDAMAAADIRRVSTTVQISDTGIQPGAGVGNNRECLNEETIGAKVIAIGVPTVIDAATISKVEIPKELAPLMVTTKDIDLVIERTAKTVANGINLALHRDMTLRDIESYV